MKRILLTLLCCLTVVFVSAQNTSQNYLHTRKMLNSTATGYVDHISYHDGLGRPFQTVEQHWPSSGSASTLVTQQEYDLLGRPSVSRLPLPGSSSFVSPNSVATSVATHYGDSYAYSTISYDSTARERVVSEQGEGSAWQGKVISTEYLSSGTSGDLLCQHYKLNTLANVTQNGAYAAGALQVVKTTDEDGKVAIPSRISKDVPYWNDVWTEQPPSTPTMCTMITGTWNACFHRLSTVTLLRLT